MEKPIKTEKLKTAVVREEFVALTGDLEKALILNQFIYWSERVRDFDRFIHEEQERRVKENMENVNIEYQHGWIYKDMNELKEEIMLTSSISTISRKINELVEAGWLQRRRNPKYKWDKRYQYRVDLIKIVIDLFNIGYILQKYRIDPQFLLQIALQTAKASNLQNESSNLHSEASNLQNESSVLQNEKAISEITTKITKKIDNDNDLDASDEAKKEIVVDNSEKHLEIIDKLESFKDFVISDIGLDEERLSPQLLVIITEAFYLLLQENFKKYSPLVDIYFSAPDILLAVTRQYVEAEQKKKAIGKKIDNPYEYMKTCLLGQIPSFSNKGQAV